MIIIKIVKILDTYLASSALSWFWQRRIDDFFFETGNLTTPFSHLNVQGKLRKLANYVLDGNFCDPCFLENETYKRKTFGILSFLKVFYVFF